MAKPLARVHNKQLLPLANYQQFSYINCVSSHVPVWRLKRTLTIVCSGRPTVSCKYLATTVFKANLTKFCSPQPNGSTRRLSRFGGDAISPIQSKMKNLVYMLKHWIIASYITTHIYQ